MRIDDYGSTNEEDVYMPDEYIDQSVEDDEMSPSEAWFIQGWKTAY